MTFVGSIIYIMRIDVTWRNRPSWAAALRVTPDDGDRDPPPAGRLQRGFLAGQSALAHCRAARNGKHLFQPLAPQDDRPAGFAWRVGTRRQPPRSLTIWLTSRSMRASWPWGGMRRVFAGDATSVGSTNMAW